MKQEERTRNPWSDKDVEAHWDKVAPIYVQENEKVLDTHEQRFRESISHLRLAPGLRILNITSRDGEASDHILKSCPNVHVVNAEISAGLIELAARLRPNIKQVKLVAYSGLPFRNGEFDRILCLETLEHVAEPKAFLRELHRVTTPEALMVLTCPPATSEIPYRIYTMLFGGHGEGPHRFLSSHEVKSLFEHTGWKLLQHKGTVLLPIGPAWLRRWAERMIERMQGTFVAELGIRQVYACEKQ